MSDDLRISFLQRQAAIMRQAAAHETDPVLKEEYLRSAARYLEELNQLRAADGEASEAA